ncbi:MAG: response regulator, partial [Candidatus Schekmanbacteria bacterium]|nr:response regulator [Candidatus Schekmanbacteria bacterium]
MEDRDITRQILVVDDEATIRTGIAQALGKEKMTVHTAADSREALEILATQPLGIVLLDIKLPDMDGVELLKIIRREYPEIEVIMVTGYPAIQSAVECIRHGAMDYLVKPFRLDELEVLIAKAQDLLIQKHAPLSPEESRAQG